MTIQNSPFSTRIAEMPNRTLATVYEFLKTDIRDRAGSEHDKVILATSQVCKSWREDPGLQAERNEAIARCKSRLSLKAAQAEVQILRPFFPTQLVRIFKRAHMPIAQLPAVQLPPPQRRLGTAINYIKPGDMHHHPVVRFTCHLGRPGVAILVRGRNNVDALTYGQNLPAQVRGIEGVITLYKNRLYRHRPGPQPENYWVWQVTDKVENLYYETQRARGHTGGPMEDCPNCPDSRCPNNLDHIEIESIYPFVTDLLTGLDPIFTIPDPVLNDAAQAPGVRRQFPATEEKKGA